MDAEIAVLFTQMEGGSLWDVIMSRIMGNGRQKLRIAQRRLSMSILIKGMEMPKDGAFVEVLIWSDGHVTQTGDSYFAEDGRAYYKSCDWKHFSAVPVPKHGRLIDADDTENITVIMNDNGSGFNRIIAPTIIPAEEEE